MNILYINHFIRVYLLKYMILYEKLKFLLNLLQITSFVSMICKNYIYTFKLNMRFIFKNI